MIYNEDFHQEWPIIRQYTYVCDKCGHMSVADKYNNSCPLFSKLVGLLPEKHDGKCRKCKSIMNKKFVQQMYIPETIGFH